MTLTLIFIMWAAGSYVEYRLVNISPVLKKMYGTLAGSLIISLVVTGGIGYMVGGGLIGGAAAVLSIATSKMTNAFFDGLHASIRWGSQAKNKVKSVKAEHPTLFNEGMEGIKAGFKVLVAILLFVVYMLGAPLRIYRWFKNKYLSIKMKVAAFRS